MRNISCLKMCITGAVLVSALCITVFADLSDMAEKQLFIGPRATYSTPSDAGRGQLDGGIQARIHMLSGLGLEGSIDYRSITYFDATTVKTYPIQGSLLAYPKVKGDIKPILLGGIGWYITQVNGPVGYSKTDFRFGLHVGAGLEFMLNSNMSIDGTYRYIWLESVVSKDVNALDKTYQDGGSMITIALNFLFKTGNTNVRK